MRVGAVKRSAPYADPATYHATVHWVEPECTHEQDIDAFHQGGHTLFDADVRGLNIIPQVVEPQDVDAFADFLEVSPLRRFLAVNLSCARCAHHPPVYPITIDFVDGTLIPRKVWLVCTHCAWETRVTGPEDGWEEIGDGPCGRFVDEM